MPSSSPLKTRAMASPERLRQLLGLIDLTSLNDAKDDDIVALCTKAQTPHGPVAAVCSWPAFAGQMTEALEGTGIPSAVVINFPSGEGTVQSAVLEAEAAVASGARELDLVWPYRAWQGGDRRAAVELVGAVKRAGRDARLKVILESGAFDSLEALGAASRDVIAAGADMLKTSTGKIPLGASLPAARVMLEQIKSSGQPVGFKASGGIRSVAEAEAYLALAEEVMDQDWPTAANFRIGASRLLDQILDQLL